MLLNRRTESAVAPVGGCQDPDDLRYAIGRDPIPPADLDAPQTYNYVFPFSENSFELLALDLFFLLTLVQKWLRQDLFNFFRKISPILRIVGILNVQGTAWEREFSNLLQGMLDAYI